MNGIVPPETQKYGLKVRLRTMGHRRKIIFYCATSLDGYIARKDGGIDWLDRPRPKGNYGMNQFLKTINTIIWGRNPQHGRSVHLQRQGAPLCVFPTPGS